MHESPLTPVFAALQLSMHVLIGALAAVVFLRAVLLDAPHMFAIATLAVVFVVVYLLGVTRGLRGGVMWAWLVTLTVLWLVLVALAPDAAYIVFGLFFLYLRLLPRPWSLVAVAGATVVAVTGTAVHRGWSVAGVVGPVIGASVAVVIGLGYQALYREAAERQRLIDELISTREELADQERHAGKLFERERLAREIHDTVAQGLSSIHMLLHAVERSAPDHPAVEQIRLARATASDSLAETRQLIAELTPAALDGQSLTEALTRICALASTDTLRGEAVVEGDAIGLPMPLEAALVRIAQGAVSNVVRHAHARRMAVTLTYADDLVSLDVVDDGIGFDVTALERGPAESFGLGAIGRRVEMQGGSMQVESEPGHTAVAVSFPLDPLPPGEAGTSA
ncbi:MAG: sensor histidine kinase [Rhodococcus sp. (in: high G+C Gram-positive bacteria)]|uniref:sensor histidine kinase n=1 Tax=Rhodococcus sp. TaxID=1831 RepID=UPI003BAF97E3